MATESSHTPPRTSSAPEYTEVKKYSYPFEVFFVAHRSVFDCFETFECLHDSLAPLPCRDEVKHAVRAELSMAWKYVLQGHAQITRLADQPAGAFDDISQDVLDEVMKHLIAMFARTQDACRFHLETMNAECAASNTSTDYKTTIDRADLSLEALDGLIGEIERIQEEAHRELGVLPHDEPEDCPVTTPEASG